MDKARVNAAAIVLVFCILFAGCNSSNTNASPTVTPANLSGDYTGTMQDAQGGAGTVTATFAQHGATAGGALTDKETTVTITAQVSLAISSANSISGAMVVNYASGTTCTFSTTGAYDPSTGVLTGSYSAVTNCSGDTGTFTLNQQCFDTVTNIKRRTMTFPAHC